MTIKIKKTAKAIIKSKYEQSFKIEEKIVKIWSEKRDLQRIGRLLSQIDEILADIDAIAIHNGIFKEELDRIFSEIYISQ